MTTHVVATAGHVDHGKSTLVRALTGMEPDRWTEERRRGLTIDLGFAWTRLPSGRQVAFVDVPGHERFLGNMLAGIGPAPIVCFVVAADQGWSAQSSDHRDAVAALGIDTGLVVVTRADRAPDRVEETVGQARDELRATGLADARVVVVSAVKGTGMAKLRQCLDLVLGAAPAPDSTGRLRLWVDRSFSIKGTGTVVTGTLAAGSIVVGDQLELMGSVREPRLAAVRGLQSHGHSHNRLKPVSRAAVNLRGIPSNEIQRGHALLTPGAWPATDILDVRRATGVSLNEIPEHLTMHIGTAAVHARLRAFGADHGRMRLDRPLPIVIGDRLLLLDPGARKVLGGVQVLDPEPAPLRRRGDGTRRGLLLASTPAGGDVVGKVAERGAIDLRDLQRLGFVGPKAQPPEQVRAIDGWWVHLPTFGGWCSRLREMVEQQQARDQLTAGVSEGSARAQLGSVASRFLDQLVAEAGLERYAGRVRLQGSARDLGGAEAAVAQVEQRLRAAPFDAPEARDLAALGIGVKVLAAAERQNRLMRLPDGVVLLPSAPALAMQTLSQLPQPFTTSQAREALGTSRRIAIPLLEALDQRGWTRRVDERHREVVR